MNALSAREVQHIIKLLHLKKHNGKCSELLSLMINEGDKGDDEIARVIFRQEKTSKLSHLKKRLQENILDWAVLNNAGKQDDFSWQCNKLIQYSCWFFNKRMPDEGVQYLKKASELADTYELLAYKLLINELMIQNTNSNNIKFKNTMDQDLEKYKDTMEAQSIKSVNGKESYGHLINSKSKKASFLYQLKYLQEHMTVIPYVDSMHNIQNLHEMLNDKVFTGSLQESNQLKRMEAKIHLIHGQFEKAMEQVGKLQQQPVSALDHDQTDEIKFLCQFRAGKFETCKQIINHHTDDNDHNGKWTYYNACCEFLKDDYKKCIKLLNHTFKISGKNTLMLMHAKVLEIICLIEFADIDWLYYKMESLRKLIARNNTLKAVRIKTIYFILNRLLKDNLDFSRVYHDNHDPIESLLQEAGKENAWDPDGFELIRFHHWFLNKSNNSSLQLY